MGVVDEGEFREGAWVNKAKVEGDVNKAATGGEVQGGITTMIPNKNLICHISSLKIRMVHGH